MEQKTCWCCGSKKIKTFYEVKKVPVHSVLCIATKKEAISFRTGDIKLAFCKDCGFVFNALFDIRNNEYSEKYEATQSFSPTFNKFNEKLARNMIEKFDLHNKDIIEIGCGHGEFLKLLVDIGNNRCVGFDPAYRSDVGAPAVRGKLEFVKELFSEKHKDYKADFVCCKMTLEHIQDVYDFVSTVKKSVKNKDAVIFFQIPNFETILKDLVFWDVYYEHSSYFTKASLFNLFNKAGFSVKSIWTDFDDQYLMIEAGLKGKSTLKISAKDLAYLESLVDKFKVRAENKIAEWGKRFASYKKFNKKVVVWSSSSKAVSFLTALKPSVVEYVIDINPRRQGFFMAGTGQEIMSPEFLKKYKPDVVIIMNPIYLEEIKKMLSDINVNTEIITV
ncbi:TPA: methyltransferase domain-containing protein [Candidatus Woesearchaeota archaeon]|nr:methyltransferase domain-containing protein [Candidatus Woesearchaeota archaeon]HIH32495.1 methyltransferase domain-containing protein [Candidatus Woesearchaeota archaeon]HIH55207.1 methyltransferase domain-containing protein [Candidatus Woesearchaeota archaeon]HIJ01488.1 methyltransferase domain-containing protein [Candidatus Woesearchaeota archaeon]HIJ13470.1 methyltransferase domain-containing protein [Candidatus Woesearchaeota archaeon]